MLLTTIWICFFISSSLAIEEPIRAQNLKPRHFNPHPFQNNPNRRSDRVGPVVFNENQSLQRPPPVQDVPYLKVVKKYKKKKVGRFDVEEEKINPQLQQALAKHGAKVLKLPPEKLARDHIPFVREIEKHHPNYAFSYKVLDHSSGDDFSHSQVQDSRTTNGEYRVKLPDGRLQIVSYTADQNGYKADVKYMESEDINNNVYHPPPVYHQIQRIPIRERAPVKATRKHYYNDVRAINHHHELTKFSSIVPTAVPVPDSYDRYEGDYGNILVTPSPGYSNGIAANAQLPLPLNVQIFTTNARDYHNPGSYVPIVASTPHTYHAKDISHYRQNPILPEIINNGDQGIVLPLSTPSSFVLTDQHGQVIDNIKLVTSTAVPYVVSSTPMPHFVTIHSTASPSRSY
ncbi:uncharacterized protein LOC114326585 [Diabrotica virgifera virgifera]|uniref:Uncharacterized protein n=1 Tax=Diabrotica virgifera virgifera TaxID=50390 RepID=A0ABM5L8S0_DIAVI|nr:uncharacterized protein LOC114326585 [Diabrotica virgifera virgifera]